ncbi:hypothetical protein MOV61_11840 [Neorhizobium sp. BETTINA12A]|uniref:DUF6656 family protein n=1 Tax=Neorhizobium sp. BETTINA12A TaxID=2908924 RepID=UPI001FF3FD7B|nr:DUF6656 family protein [Neorhizobium sp. BETTINA12A]MCJ9751408.1 hypothetical protein [Neorhizobium sp. BETTINA12A]
MKKIARSALSVASVSSEVEVASARYARWFSGETGEPEPMATSAKRFRRITADMAGAEVIAVTKENLSILGDDASGLFTSKLPTGHRMRKAIRSSVLPSVPHLGTCKFGEIVTGRSQDAFAVTQIFIANFDGDIDTTARGGNLYKPKSRDFDQMFFGLHIILDHDGNFLGFNQKLGDEGVAFKTKDITIALYNIASASTGLSMEALQARAAASKKAMKA